MARLRIGYVGCGFMAQKVHIPNIASLDEECELVGVAEVRTELGKRVQTRYGFSRLYKNHTELADDSSLDAVAISAHGTIQGDIAADILRSGKHVFLEKPMAVSAEQGARILEAEKASGKRLMIAYLKRYDAGNVLVKSLLEEYKQSGAMGQIRYARNHGFCGQWDGGLDTPMESTDESYPESGPVSWPEWLPEKHRGGYYEYLQQYTHNVNLLRWFLEDASGTRVESVHLEKERGVAGVVALRVGGVCTIIESGSTRYHGWDEHTQIYFDEGWIRTEAPPLLLRNVPATVEVYRGNDTNPTQSHLFPKGGYTWAYKEEMRHFIKSLNEDTPFDSSGADALKDVELLEEIYRRHAL